MSINKSTRLYFTGSRRQDFTVTGPITGMPYYVEVGSREPIRFDAADAAALVERDGHLWDTSRQGREVTQAAPEMAEAESE